jgi:hypothetical protein
VPSKLPGLEYAEVPDVAQPHRIDRVERETASGRDSEGGAVEAWAQVYQDLRCAVIPGDTADYLEWEQKGLQATHKVYFGAQADGKLPMLGVRDRLFFGTYPGTNVPRILQVVWAQDEVEAGIVFIAHCLERRPG